MGTGQHRKSTTELQTVVILSPGLLRALGSSNGPIQETNFTTKPQPLLSRLSVSYPCLARLACFESLRDGTIQPNETGRMFQTGAYGDCGGTSCIADAAHTKSLQNFMPPPAETEPTYLPT